VNAQTTQEYENIRFIKQETSPQTVIVLNSKIIDAWKDYVRPFLDGIKSLVVNGYIPAVNAMEMHYLLNDLMDISKDFHYEGHHYNMQSEVANFICNHCD
jgi:hypothetical protein